MDRAELIELLKKARKQLKKYHVPKDEQTVTLSIDTIENALLEQPDIVQCGDCKHNARCEIAFGCNGNREWFCADGERAL